MVQPTAVEERTLWPLAWTFWVDLLIIGILLVVVNIGLGAFIAGRALQQGVSLVHPDGSPDLERFTQLLGTTGFLLAVLLQSLIFIAIPLIRITLVRHESLTQLGFRVSQPMKLILQGIGLGALMLVINITISAIFTSFGVVQNQTDQFPLFEGDLRGHIMVALAATVLAPVGEEVLFRGYAFNAFAQQWGPIAAYVLSALLFSIAHSLAATEGVTALLVPAFIIGLVLAFGMRRTGSLLPCIVAHAFNNAVAIGYAIACSNNTVYCQN